MSEDEWTIADQILALVQQRYQWQISRLKELLGGTDNFEIRVADLCKKANKT